MRKNILYPMQLSFSSQRSRNRLNTDLHEILPQIVLDYGSHFWAIFYISSNPLRFNRVGNKSTLKHPIHINFDPVKPVSIDMDVLNGSSNIYDLIQYKFYFVAEYSCRVYKF